MLKSNVVNSPSPDARFPCQMIHVLLRVAVWVLILGGAYLVFGPDLFDSSPEPSPFANESPLYLPPAKTRRESELEASSKERSLTSNESEEFRDLVRQRQSGFWQQQGVTVDEALAGIKTGRRAELASILQGRGLTREEITTFLFVVDRDQPGLLADR